MTKLDAGLITSLPTSDSGSTAAWGSKRTNPHPQSCLCLTWSGYPSNDDDYLALQFEALVVVVVVVVWKGIHSRSNTNRTGDEGLSFYYPRLLYCLNQMLAVMLLSQHRVSSSKTVRPRAPCGARCIGHAVITRSAVCSEAPHSQFGEEARPHLCMDEWNRPTPVRRRLSLTQAARVSPSQQAWHRSRAQKHGSWKHFHNTPFSICDLSVQKRGCQVRQVFPKIPRSWYKRT